MWTNIAFAQPSTVGTYIVIIEKLFGKKQLKLMRWDGERFLFNLNPRKALMVTHWMPTPEFPKRWE